MNTSGKILSTAILLSLLSAFATQAQVTEKRTYRVTALKQGNTSITSTSNYAEVLPQLSVYIPNSFTPNGDGINDFFGIKGEGVSGFTLRVFDRWGEVIFESHDANVQWNGKYKNENVQAGAYAYIYSALNKDGGETQSGTVTLIR